MKTVTRIFALILVVVMLFSMAACGGNNAPSATEGKTESKTENNTESKTEEKTDAPKSSGEKVINRGIIGAPGSLNPLVDAGGAQFLVLEMVFDRLFDRSSKNELLPRLADSYEANDDFTEYVVHLNKAAKWTDGEDVTADDVVWTYEMYTNPAVGTTFASKVSALKGVDSKTGLRVDGEAFGVTKVDEDTVKFEMTRTAFPWDFFNSYMYVFPQHVYSAVDPSTLLTSELWLTPVGSGYCTLDSYVDGSVYEFKANKNYYLGTPDFDRMIVKSMEQSSLLGALMSGEIDMTVGHAGRGNISTADVEVAQTQGNLTLYAGGVSILYMALNNEKLDVNLRKAIDLAVDKEMMANNVFFGYAEVLNNLCPPSSLHYDTDLPAWQRNVEEAKKLLAQSDWDTSKPIELLVDSGNTERQQLAVIVQQNLAEIGLDVEITNMDYTSLLDKCRGTSDGDFEMAIVATAFLPEFAAFTNMFTPKGPTNFSYSDDSGLHDRLYAASQAIDFNERHELLCDVQEYLIDQMPFVWLVNQQSVFCYNNQVVKECDLTNAGDMVWRMWDWKFEK